MFGFSRIERLEKIIDNITAQCDFCKEYHLKNDMVLSNQRIYSAGLVFYKRICKSCLKQFKSIEELKRGTK
jgi:hypothetical protein